MEDELYAAGQEYIASATRILEEHNSNQVSGKQFDASEITIIRENEGLRTIISSEEMSFTLANESGQWEIYENTVDGQQVYHANKDDLKQFRQMIDNTEFSV